MSKFNIGSRVRVTERYCNAKKGMIGTVVIVDDDTIAPYGIKFDKSFAGGHDLRGACENGYGHWISEDCLEQISAAIHIEQKDNTITATFTDGKKFLSARAKCSPDDIFNFATGAKLAFDRLMEKINPPKFKVGDIVVGNEKANKYGTTVQGWRGKVTKVDKNYFDASGFSGLAYDCFDLSPKLFNGKVVCVEDNANGLIVGKIYKFVDGVCTDSRVRKIIRCPIISVNDLNSKFCKTKFIEIKE